jgi:hypothetical protein
MRIFLLALVLLSACDKKADEKKPPKPHHWSEAGKAWADSMVVLLPKMMCTDAGYFVSCFPKAKADCKSIALAQVNDCLDQNPDWVPQDVNRATGEEAGTKVGSCTGRQLELELRKRGAFTDTPRCNDANYWMKVMKDEATAMTKDL